MSSKQKIKLRLPAVIAKFGEFPLECTSHVPVFEVRGNIEATVYGCDRIIEYTSGAIDLVAKGMAVKIIGESLQLSEFFGGGVNIEGRITSVMFQTNEQAQEAPTNKDSI